MSPSLAFSSTTYCLFLSAHPTLDSCQRIFCGIVILRIFIATTFFITSELSHLFFIFLSLLAADCLDRDGESKQDTMRGKSS